MSEEIVKFDLAKAAEELRGRIRSAFIDMLPPEQFQAAVKQELEAFMRGKEPGSFSDECRKIFREEVKLRITSELNSHKWHGQTKFDGQGQMTGFIASDAVGAWLNENATVVVQAVLQEMMGGAVQRVIEASRRGY